MSVLSTALLAINWEPELRGVLTVIIGTAVWMGSVYLIVGTNVGARLGLLVSLAGLMGWMALMGAVWWIYGIGLKGDAPAWVQVEGRTVIQDVRLLHEAGVLDDQLPVDATDPDAASNAVATALESQGWQQVDPSAPEYGQAQSAAEVFLIDEGAFAAGEYAVTAVYEVDPPHESAYPKLFGRDELDFVAFWHKPYYTLGEVAPNTPVFTEFQGGHWFSLFGGLWATGRLPPLELRTMTSDLPDRSVLPDNVPNGGRQSGKFFARLLLAWVAMGFRVPKGPQAAPLAA